MSGYPRLVFRQFTQTADTKVLVHFRKQNTQVQRTQVTRITIIPKAKLRCFVRSKVPRNNTYHKNIIKNILKLLSASKRFLWFIFEKFSWKVENFTFVCFKLAYGISYKQTYSAGCSFISHLVYFACTLTKALCICRKLFPRQFSPGGWAKNPRFSFNKIFLMYVLHQNDRRKSICED